MAKSGDIRRQQEIEINRRRRLAVPAFGGGFLYLLSSIVISETVNGAPTVGVLQGMAPALEGITTPKVAPRTKEVKFDSHHAVPLIAGSVIAAVAVAALTLILLLILDATVFRRPETWRAARPLIIGGGIAVASLGVLHQIVLAIETHKFATGSDHSIHAVEQALTTNTANVIIEYVALLAGLALAAGMIGTMLNALRVGLVVRWMGILGMFTGLLILLPIGGAELQVVPALWMVMMGVLFAGKWPGGDPPAWAAGEARPWPSGAQMRAERVAAAGGRKAAVAGAGADVVPEPSPRTGGSSRKRRRKR